MKGHVKTGTYTGTGAAINVSLGFVPTYLVIWNITDGDYRWEWFYGQTAGHACQIADTGSGTTDLSVITSNGVTAYTGSSTVGSEAAPGFTVGTALSESAKVFRYLAIRDSE